MAETGFRDYQQYPNWRGSFTSATAVGVTSGSPVTVKLNVTNYASVFLSAACTSGTGITVTVQFYTDSGETVALGQFTYVVLNGGELYTFIPCAGSYVTLEFSTGQAGTQDVNYAVQLLNVAPPHPSYPVPTNYEGGYDVSNAAGATFTFTMPQTAEGDGICVVNPRSGGSAMTIEVDELTEGNAVKAPLARSLNPAGPVSLVFRAGTRPVQLSVTNTGTSSHAFDWSVSIAGR